MIRVADHIKNAFSDADAAVIAPLVEAELNRSGSVVLDFSGIRFFTTLFFNNAVCKYVLQYGPEEFRRRVTLRGLSEIGQDTFQHSYENACGLAALPEGEREALAEELQSLGEER